MEFSNRDSTTNPLTLLGTNSGQAIVEYILILVVTVGLVLGSVYKFNDSFRIWADEYFGSYIPCLLETGELPTIDGSPGDSGLCMQFNKKFSDEGKSLLAEGGGGGGSGHSASGPSERENSHSGGAGGGGGHGGSQNGTFGRNGSAGSGSGGGFGKGPKQNTDSNTGNLATTNYGNGYGALNRRLDTSTKQRLDNHFAFEDEKPDKVKRSVTSAPKSGPESNQSSRTKLHTRSASLNRADLPEDKPFTFGAFFRILIIAAILIALAVFIGGQMLQIGKSME